MKNNVLTIAFWFLLFIQIITAFYFCCQKQGFHEDEFYSYYSTSRTYGLSVPDGDWLEHDDYYNEFVVLEGEGFQYGLVKLVQSWDVHPPLYYWVLHTVCSIFKGQFSKWFGLGINLVCFGIGMILLREIVLRLSKNNERLVLIICGFWGFSPAVMSSVVFIRMYAMLTIFVYLCVILHLDAVKKREDNVEKLSYINFLIPIAVITYLGFMTQYYYFIFIFFIGAAFSVYLLWKDRNLYNCIRYAFSVGIAFLMGYITYPSCLGQMFRGQRGAKATSDFFDLTNTIYRIKYFWDIMDEHVFGGLILLFVGIIVVLIVLSAFKKAFVLPPVEYIILLFAVVGYFLAVSKTALMLGGSSVRYEMPIYGLVIAIVIIAIASLLYRYEILDKPWQRALVFGVSFVFCAGISIWGLGNGKVLFLYQEAEDRVAFSQEIAENDVPVIYLYDSNDDWCIWASADELFSYSKVYFASQDNDDIIVDETIGQSAELLVYIASSEGATEQVERILNSNKNVSSYEVVYQETYCDVYYFR